MIHSIDGKYVPFGVFALYNDSCLRNSLEACMTVILQLPSYQVSVCYDNESYDGIETSEAE